MTFDFVSILRGIFDVLECNCVSLRQIISAMVNEYQAFTGARFLVYNVPIRTVGKQLASQGRRGGIIHFDNTDQEPLFPEFLANSFNGLCTHTFHPLKTVYNVIARISQDLRLFVVEEVHAQPLLDGDIVWDKIISIEPLGLEHVYDIEVEGTHNFIGNSIFAHNTYMDAAGSNLMVPAPQAPAAAKSAQAAEPPQGPAGASNSGADESQGGEKSEVPVATGVSQSDTSLTTDFEYDELQHIYRHIQEFLKAA